MENTSVPIPQQPHQNNSHSQNSYPSSPSWRANVPSNYDPENPPEFNPNADAPTLTHKHAISGAGIAIIIVGIVLLGLLIGHAIGLFIQSKSNNQCYTRSAGIVDAGCDGTTMLRREKIELCCPDTGCKFWKYEPAAPKPNDPRCLAWNPTPTPNPNDQNQTYNKKELACKSVCNHYNLGEGYLDKDGICHCGSPDSTKIVGTECTTNSQCASGICIDGHCIDTSNPGYGPIAQANTCSSKEDGASCEIKEGAKTYQGTCYNGNCYNNNYVIVLKAATETEAEQKCKAMGGYMVKLDNGQYLCVGCQNKPVAQAPIVCLPPQCTGAKECVDPGTVSAGTDCLWYICDTNGSGRWIQTDTSCKEPAPTGTVDSPTPTPTSTPSPTETPTETPSETPTETPTPTSYYTPPNTGVFDSPVALAAITFIISTIAIIELTTGYITQKLLALKGFASSLTGKSKKDFKLRIKLRKNSKLQKLIEKHIRNRLESEE